MIRWRRLVLVPGRFLALFAVLYAIFEGGLSLLEWYLGIARVESRAGKAMLVGACLTYAVFRVTSFHPLNYRRYGQWLRTTPWTSSKPLPLGPIHLVWQDGVPLLLIALLGFLQGDVNPLQLLTFFLTVYLTVLALDFRVTGQWAFAYAVAFGLGLVVRLWYR